MIKRLGFFRHDILAVAATREVVERLEALPVQAHHEPLSGIDVAHKTEGDAAGVDALQFGHHYGIIGETALGDGTAACALHLDKPCYEVFAVVGEVVGRMLYLVAIVTTESLRRVFYFGEKPYLVRDRCLLCINEFAGGQHAVKHTWRVDDVGVTGKDVLKVDVADTEEGLVFEAFAFGVV